MSKTPLNMEQVGIYVANIQKWLDEAIESDYEQGLSWYADARAFAAKKAIQYGIKPIQVATLISILSPQKKWEQNLEEVSAFLEEFYNGVKPAKSYFASQKSLDECTAALRDGWVIPAHRSKTFAFADNIANENSSHVTVDRHAIKVANDDLTAKEISITAKRYREAEAAYNIVALEENLKPYQIQAITWVAYKRVVGR